MIDPKSAVATAYQRVLSYLESEEALQGHRLAYQHVAAVRQLRDMHLAELTEWAEGGATSIDPVGKGVLDISMEPAPVEPSSSLYPYRRGGRRRSVRG